MTRRILAAMALAAVPLLITGLGISATADPSNCVQNGSKHAYLCYWHSPGTGGGVYGTLVLFENWYYWHPQSGDQVVQETYAKSGAPGYDSATGHRVISFADGATVADPAWLDGFPGNTGPPADCSRAGAGMWPCTALEQQSAMGFQHAMTADGIANSF